MRCAGCLRVVPPVPGTYQEDRCLGCQRDEVARIVDACVRRGWEAQQVTLRGRLRVSVNTPIGNVTVTDTEDLTFVDVDVAA